MRAITTFCVVLLAACSSGTSALPMQAYTVRGRFVDADTGRGIPHARVEILQRNTSFFGNLRRGGMDAPPTSLGATTTDANGRFVFRVHSRGPYELRGYSKQGRKSGFAQLARPQNESVTVIGSPLPEPPPLFPDRKT